MRSGHSFLRAWRLVYPRCVLENVQLYLPHPDLYPASAHCVDGPLAGQSYMADYQHEVVPLGPGILYRLLQGERGEYYYEQVRDPSLPTYWTSRNLDEPPPRRIDVRDFAEESFL